jgi:hypothetical protein
VSSSIHVINTANNCSIAGLDLDFSALRELTSALDLDCSDSIFRFAHSNPSHPRLRGRDGSVMFARQSRFDQDIDYDQ